jgi:hypothetical protein
MSPFSAVLGLILVFFLSAGHPWFWPVLAGFALVAVAGFVHALLH